MQPHFDPARRNIFKNWGHLTPHHIFKSKISREAEFWYATHYDSTRRIMQKKVTWPLPTQFFPTKNFLILKKCLTKKTTPPPQIFSFFLNKIFFHPNYLANNFFFNQNLFPTKKISDWKFCLTKKAKLANQIRSSHVSQSAQLTIQNFPVRLSYIKKINFDRLLIAKQI